MGECANVDPVSECKFDLQAGPSTIPIKLGFVTDDCCVAAETHASGGDTLNAICADESCIRAYDSLFQQGQAFTNPGSTDTLEDVCMALEPMAEEAAEDETTTTEEEEETGPLIPNKPGDAQGEKTMTEEKATSTEREEGPVSAAALSLGRFAAVLLTALV